MEHTLRTSRGDFPALCEGPEDGPAALLLHGFPDIPATFQPALRLLAAAGWRAVAPWLRGYAPGPLEGPFNADTLAADIAALARALRPGSPITLIGHDWGAVGACVAAARYPELFRSLITISVPHPLAFLRSLLRDPGQIRRSWYMGLFQLPGVAERALLRDDFALIDRLWAAWSPGFTPPADHLSLIKDCLGRSTQGPLGYYRSILQPPLEALARLREPAMRSISVPTLYLCGASDGCIAPSAAQGQEKYFSGHFSSEVVAHVGHFLPLERPALLVDRILTA